MLSSITGPELATIPGAPIVARIRRLLLVALAAGLGYAALLHASKGYCSGGVETNGRFTDAAGHATDSAPQCVGLTLGPSPFVYLAIAGVLLVAISMVLRRAHTVASALRILDRAAAVIGILVVASIIIAQVWFAVIPITEWSNTGPVTFYYPFPFGSVNLATSVMGS